MKEKHSCAPKTGMEIVLFSCFNNPKGRPVLLLNDDSESISMAKTIHNGMRDLVITERQGHTPVDETAT